MLQVENYPFKEYKVSRLHEETAKRSLSKDQVETILKYKLNDPYTALAIDIFAFSYYCGGINFVDIANLAQDNLIEGKLIYKRHKTGKLIKIPIQPQALKLIDKHHKEDSPYLYPILSPFHKTEIQKANRVHKVFIFS